MSGVLFRFSVIQKNWLRSLSFFMWLLLFPLAIYYSWITRPYAVEELTSFLYEQFGVLAFIMILYKFFSIDIDSSFLEQVVTYPIKMSTFIFEKIIHSFIIFVFCMAVVTIWFESQFFGEYWGAFLLTVPTYIGFAGLFACFSITFKHSLAGVTVCLMIWILPYIDMRILLYANPVVLDMFGGYDVVQGGLQTEKFSLVIWNRVLYLVIGVIGYVVSILMSRRKTR